MSPASERTKKRTMAENTEKKQAAKKDAAATKENKKIAELEARIKELEEAAAKEKEAAAKEKDDYIRLMAEFETFRRRTAEDRLNLISSASADTIKGMLPTLDECERAMQLLEQSSDEAAKEGTSLIYNKLLSYLKSRGLEKIEAKGQAFDTDFHEAVTQFPAPAEEDKGKVIDVVQNGYKLGDKVIRYAKVVVGA